MSLSTLKDSWLLSLLIRSEVYGMVVVAAGMITQQEIYQMMAAAAEPPAVAELFTVSHIAIAAAVSP